MSKSRGTFVMARTYLDHLNAEYLRYYYAAKLSSGVDDIDLNLEDFHQRVNSDLVGKYINIASRASGFITKKFDGKLLSLQDDKNLMDGVLGSGTTIAEFYEAREYGKAIKDIMKYADSINQYFDDKKPWLLAKDDSKADELHEVCSRTLHGFYALSIMLAPILPSTTEKVAKQLFGMDRAFVWKDLETCPVSINKFKPLMTRIEKEQIDKIVEASKQQQTAHQKLTKTNTGNTAIDIDPIAAEIEFEDFSKVDLRIAKIIKAEHVEKADKLLQLTLDIGGRNSQCICWHQVSVFTRRTGRQTHRDGGQSEAQKNALWVIGGHGTGCRAWG